MVDIRGPAAPRPRLRVAPSPKHAATAEDPPAWSRDDVADELQYIARAVTAHAEGGTDPCPSSDATDTAWRCLGVELRSLPPFVITYRHGDDYVSLPAGGLDPGPEGFEVAARADLGHTVCILAMTATLRPGPGPMAGPRWATQIYASEGCPPRDESP